MLFSTWISFSLAHNTFERRRRREHLHLREIGPIEFEGATGEVFLLQTGVSEFPPLLNQVRGNGGSFKFGVTEVLIFPLGGQASTLVSVARAALFVSQGRFVY